MTDKQFLAVEMSYKHSDNLPIMVGNRIFVCFGNIHTHNKNTEIHFEDCSEVTERCFDGGYYGDVEPGKMDIYLQNHLWEEPNAVETIFYEDELIEIIAQ